MNTTVEPLYCGQHWDKYVSLIPGVLNREVHCNYNHNCKQNLVKNKQEKN